MWTEYVKGRNLLSVLCGARVLSTAFFSLELSVNHFAKILVAIHVGRLTATSLRKILLDMRSLNRMPPLVPILRYNYFHQVLVQFVFLCVRKTETNHSCIS